MINYVHFFLLLFAFLNDKSIAAVYHKPTSSVSMLAASVNVKTVIFKEEDYMRPCFDVDTVQILVARRVMQDLIPKKVAKDFSALLDYINKAEIILKMKTRDEKEYMHMKRAFYDAMGGYLYAFTIPVINEAFYAGKVEYNVANELHKVLQRMMNYLRTNGGMWADPCDMDKIPTKVQGLTLNLCLQDQSCDNFVIASDLQGHLEEGEGTIKANKTNCIPEAPKIQLPFLDDDAYPNAIVVPFKEHALYSLMTPCAANIVAKYYVMAMRCLSHPQFSNEDIILFNQRLHRWIMSIVLPHLQDTDRFFPGFGGIMRIVETMNQRGLTSTATFKPNMKPLNVSYIIQSIQLDEKWYTSYYKKLTGAHSLIIIAISLFFLALAVILYHLIRKAYFPRTCEECDCYECKDDHSRGKESIGGEENIHAHSCRTSYMCNTHSFDEIHTQPTKNDISKSLLKP